MESLSYETVIATLGLVSSPDRVQREGSELFFTSTHSTNPLLFTHLFKAVVDTSLTDGVRLPASLVLEAVIKKISKENKPLLEICHENCLEALSRSPSKAVSKTLASAYFHYLDHVSALSKSDVQLVVPVYSQFFEKLEPETDPTRIYYLLVGYLRINKIFEVFLPNEQKTQLHEKIFTRLETLLEKLKEPTCAVLRPSFYRIIAKIFFVSYRYSAEAYLEKPEKTEFWMKFCHQILSEFSTYSQAATQVTRILASMFRFAMWELENKGKKNKKAKSDDNAQSEFYLNWAKTYAEPLSELFYPMIASFTPSDGGKTKKSYYNISRCFNCILNMATLKEKAIEKLFALADTLLAQAVMLQSDVEEFSDNPREYFARNNFSHEETTIRISSVSILSNLFKTSVSDKLFKHLALRAVQNKDNILINEAVFHIFERGFKEYAKVVKDRSDTFEFVKTCVIPSLNSPAGYLVCRATLLLKVMKETVEFPEDVLMAISNFVWQNMQAKDMPTRNFSITLLNNLLENEKVRDVVRPNLPNLIRIALESLKEHWHERIVINLNDVLQFFPQEAAPFMLEMIEQLVVLASRLLKDDEASNDGEQAEMKSLSLYSVFEAITTCISLETTPEMFSQIIVKLDPLLKETLGCCRTEEDEQVINLLTQLVKLSPQGNIHSLLWPYFEFLVLSLNPQGHQKAPNNCLLSILADNSENYLELSTFIIDTLSNFCSRDPQGILSRTTHLGVPYISLILNFIKDVSESKSEMLDESIKIKNVMFIAKLLYIFRDHLDSTLKDLPSLCFKETVTFSNEDMTVFDNIFIHNASALFMSAPLITYALVQEKGQVASLLAGWTKRHRAASNSEIRKASFLGLTSLLHNRHQLPLIFEHFSHQKLISFLLSDLVFLDLQMTIEDNEEDYQELEDDDEDEERFAHFDQLEDFSNLEVGVITEYLQHLSSIFMYTNENLSGHSDALLDPIMDINHVTAFKVCLAELAAKEPELITSIQAKMNPSQQEYVNKVLA